MIGIAEYHTVINKFSWTPRKLDSGQWIWLKRFKQIHRRIRSQAYIGTYGSEINEIDVYHNITNEDFLMIKLSGVLTKTPYDVWKYEIEDTKEAEEECLSGSSLIRR